MPAPSPGYSITIRVQAEAAGSVPARLPAAVDAAGRAHRTGRSQVVQVG